MVNLSLKNIQSLSQSLDDSQTFRLLAEKKWKMLKPTLTLPMVGRANILPRTWLNLPVVKIKTRLKLLKTLKRKCERTNAN